LKILAPNRSFMACNMVSNGFYIVFNLTGTFVYAINSVRSRNTYISAAKIRNSLSIVRSRGYLLYFILSTPVTAIDQAFTRRALAFTIQSMHQFECDIRNNNYA